MYEIPQDTRNFITLEVCFEFIIKILREDTGFAQVGLDVVCETSSQKVPGYCQPKTSYC